jgi:pimeloyl-ACP methyl ester carboxylesterase
VLVAHALGLGPDAYRYGQHSLVDALVGLGFQVYLLAHRGDRDVHVPRDARIDFDAILEGCVPAAVAAIQEHSGFARVHWVGHGMGGQLGLVAGARGEALASVAALAAPVRFVQPRSEMRTLSLVTRLLPDRATLPAHLVARAALPALGQTEWMGDTPGGRVRGAVEYAAEGIAGGLVDQVTTWVREGHLTSRAGLVDYEATFGRASMPLFVGYARASTVADARATTPAVDAWGHPDALAFGVDGRTADLVFGRLPLLTEWLDDRRRLAWDAAFHRARSA